jgi:excisionase family DNA binding protein
MDERWYTVEQIATTLQVHEQTVRRWLRERALAGRYFGGKTGWRVRQSDLEAFLGRDRHGRTRGESRP